MARLHSVGTVLCVFTLMAGGTGAAERPAKSSSKQDSQSKTSAEQTKQDEILATVQQMQRMLAEQRREIESQRALLNEQSAKVADLEKRLAQQTDSARAAEERRVAETEDAKLLEGQLDAVADSQNGLGEKVSKLQTDVGDTKNSLDSRIKAIGPFQFSGDIRMRYENTTSGNAVTAPSGAAQHRERFRLRFHANARFNDQLSGGFTLTSGDLNNPVSANQTLTTFHIRKPIGIDRAFITYQPKLFKPLSVTVGKFAYTWQRTEMMWDNDLNPEGLSESLHWNWKDSRLQHFGVVAFQLPINTTFSGGGTVLTPTPSSALFGGQVQSNWKLTSRTKFAANLAYYHYRNPDQIAQNQTGGVGPTTGALGGNSLTNFVGTIGTRRFFASQYGIFDVIARLDFDTGVARFPFVAVFDFAQNNGSCDNLGIFISAGVAAPFCDRHQNQAGWMELQLGRTQERGDFRFGYTFARIERDAVLSGFNFDDMRQATNVAQHRFEIFYQMSRSVTFGTTGLVGRQLADPNGPSSNVPAERYLRRFQFDLLYKF